MKIRTILSALVASLIFLNSCGTIVGGSRYHAQVVVEGRPNAQVTYEGVEKKGNARFLIKRKKANKLSFIVKEEGYETQTYNFRKRSFRGWALVGSIFCWTTSNGIPAGVITDFLTGALWKPNVEEAGVEKVNYKNFRYLLKDKPTPIIPKEKVVETKTAGGGDFIYLKDGRVIRGTILEEVVNVHVRIQTADGQVQTFTADEVKKTSLE